MLKDIDFFHIRRYSPLVILAEDLGSAPNTHMPA